MCDKDKDTLSRIFSEIEKGSFPHTCALEGGDDGAREIAALRIAASLMCDNRSEAGGCGACDTCKKVMAKSHGDLTFVDSTEKNPTPVKELRSVRSGAYMSPFEADRKVIIFHRANTLSVQGQNILLKILEEPPKDVNFILSCPSVKMLLPTVRSRCTAYSLGEIPGGEMLSGMKRVCPNIYERTLERAAQAGLRLENFDVSEANVTGLVWALSVCDGFYESGSFPYEELPAKKEDAEKLKLLLRTLSLCALEISAVKKGAKATGILKKEALERAQQKISAKVAFSHYELFLSLYERMLANANYTAILAAIRTGI